MKIIKKSKNDSKAPELLHDLEQAKIEWEHAQRYFNNVTDTDLIDFAAYNLEAARRRYIYLYNQIRSKAQ